MLDAVSSVLKNQPVVEEKKTPELISEETVQEVSPPGWSGTVKAMKKHKNIDNPFALAWSMKNKGAKSHIKPEKKNEEVDHVEEDWNKEDAVKRLEALHKREKEAQKADKKFMQKHKPGKNVWEQGVAEGSDTYKQGHAKYHTKTNKQVGPTHYGRGSDKKADSYTKADPRYHEVRPVKEEVEHIDEISKASLHSYATAAHAKYDTLRNKSDSASTEKKSKLAQGIKTANHKMNPPVQHKPEPKVDMSSPSAYYKSKGSGSYVGDSVEVNGTPLEEKSTLKGNQKKIDANHNGKIDGQDFRILRGKKKMKEDVETVEEGWDDMVKDAKDKVKSGPKPNGGSGVKQGSRYGGSKQKEEPETQKEAVDTLKKTTDTLAGPVKGGKDNEHVAYKVKLKTEAKTLSPGQDDAPFEEPYSPAPRNIKDKSGAVHTPMSRAKDLARSAMKRVKANLKDKK